MITRSPFGPTGPIGPISPLSPTGPVDKNNETVSRHTIDIVYIIIFFRNKKYMFQLQSTDLESLFSKLYLFHMT